jgi:SAM-dependent methyltransferase
MADIAEKPSELPAYYNQTRPELVRMLQPKGKCILEVGCAAGAMGSALLAAGAREVVGIDIHEPALALARGRLTAAHRVDLNAGAPLPYPPGHFDIITFADVLEHLTDPAAVLRHLRGWLANDGVILVSIPNVRHESVCLPLLVDGRWDYADWGILDRTHLRFFTLPGLARLLEDSGFVHTGPMGGSTSPAPPWLDKAAELVKALGGDVPRFLAEACVIQFIFLAKKSGPRKMDAPSAASGPWEGARKVRMLLAPESTAEPTWTSALDALGKEFDGNTEVTVLVALATAMLDAPPEAIDRITRSRKLDLRLTEAPSDELAWERLIAGASVVATTTQGSPLIAIARRAGVEVFDLSATAKGPELT